MSIINKWSVSIAKLINSSFEVSSSISNHATILGDSRENFIRDILEKFLPSNVIIGTGQIIDSFDNMSKQIDIIIYRNDFPILRTLGSSDIYLLEGVIATVEIKSRLNEEKLFEALENCKSVKDLRVGCMKPSVDNFTEKVYDKSADKLNIREQNSIAEMMLPQTFIFSYLGYKQSSLDKLIKSINKWHVPADTNGEQAILCLPEIIATEGCVAVKNHNNFLELEQANENDLKAYLDELNKFKSLTMDDFHTLLDYDSKGFNFGMAVKKDDYPLVYLISLLLECIFTKIGHQQLGQTGIQYDLTDYHTYFESNEEWKGAAVNIVKESDPKLDMMEKY